MSANMGANAGSPAVHAVPRRLVEDAWKSMNRRYAIGAAVLLAALVLLWVTGNGPGAWRAAAPGAASTPGVAKAPATASREAGGAATAPAPSAGTAPGGSAPAAASPASPASPATGGSSARAPAGPTTNGGTATMPASPAGNNGGPSAAPASPAANAGGASASGKGPSADGAAAASPAALPGAPVARLYFEPDQAWPMGELGPRLAPVLDRLGAEPDTKALVSGFHDRHGPPEHNAALAERRAQTVRRVLIREGVAADRIVLARPQQAQGSGRDREARRVEVTVTR
jgi:outer membrane protein OmpA-like peptidoglycan-associated protein